MEDGLEQNMSNYNVHQQLNPGKVVYLCIIMDEGKVKKYVILDKIEKVHKFSKNLNCKIEICKINGEHGYYESTGVKVTNIVNE